MVPEALGEVDRGGRVRLPEPVKRRQHLPHAQVLPRLRLRSRPKHVSRLARKAAGLHDVAKQTEGA